MARKVNPIINRIPIIATWRSHWYGKRGGSFAKYLEQDTRIRQWLKKRLKDGGLDRVEIERSPDQLSLNISTARPGVVIGRGGAGIEEMKKYIKKEFFQREAVAVQINIKEVSRPQLSAQIMVGNIANDLERRIPYRRIMKRALDQIVKAGARGAKLELKGRLDGNEIARKERLQYGQVPLQTLRADIDYARGAATTTYGSIGVRVWIYKGELFDRKVGVRENNEESK